MLLEDELGGLYVARRLPLDLRWTDFGPGCVDVEPGLDGEELEVNCEVTVDAVAENRERDNVGEVCLS